MKKPKIKNSTNSTDKFIDRELPKISANEKLVAK
jgi:hypothetical protein